MEKKTNFLILLASTLFILFIVFDFSFSVKTVVSQMKSVKTNFLSRFNLNPPSKNIVVILGGDVMLGRSVLTTADKLGDYSYPFDKISKTLKGANLVFVNLESPVVNNCPRSDSGMIFCTDEKMLEGLKLSNIGIVNIANNHIKNYGVDGLTQTQKFLSENNISWVGFGQLAQKEIGGVKFGFLGYDLLTYKLTDKDLKEISEAKNLVDVLIVSVHWGGEYQSTSSISQKDSAKKIIKAGADVIAGHHPHWIQNSEEIDGKLVFYSLGNLVFDQMWSEETKKGQIVKLIFKGKELKKHETTDIYIQNLGQPQLVK